MGFLDGLSGALTAGTQAATGYNVGTNEKNQTDQQNMLLLLKLMQQKRADDQARTLTAARIGDYKSLADRRAAQNDALLHPKPGQTVKMDADGNMVVINTQDATARPIMQGGGAPPSTGGTIAPSTGPLTPGSLFNKPLATAPQGIPLKGRLPNDPYGDRAIAANKQKSRDAAQAAADFGVEKTPVDPNNPTGPARYTSRATAIKEGQTAPAVVGQTNSLQGSSMAAAKANLQSAMTGMKEFEDKVKQNPDLYTPEHAGLAALASSPYTMTAKGAVEGLQGYAGQKALQKLQKDNPALWQYITRKKYVAEAILNTHRRPNQTQYEIEQELSGMGPGANAAQIDMGADRRQRMYDEVFGGGDAATPMGNPQGKAAASGKIDVDALMKKHKLTP